MIPNQLLLSFLLPLLLNYPVFAQDSCTVPKIKNQIKSLDLKSSEKYIENCGSKSIELLMLIIKSNGNDNDEKLNAFMLLNSIIYDLKEDSELKKVADTLVTILKQDNLSADVRSQTITTLTWIGSKSKSPDILNRIVKFFVDFLQKNQNSDDVNQRILTALSTISQSLANNINNKEITLSPEESSQFIAIFDKAFKDFKVRENINSEESKKNLSTLKTNIDNLKQQQKYFWLLHITKWAGKGWLIQIGFWVVLIFIYPNSPQVQAIFFWNPKVRKILGLWYVDLALTWIPFFRDKLFFPFKDDLVSDAHLDTFDAHTYFANSYVKFQNSTNIKSIREAIPEIKGQVILEGESGLGKSMSLRNLVKSSQRIVVYLPAQKCAQGVIEAIKNKLHGYVKEDPNFLESLIYSGAIDICIDGLNEVTPDTRAKIAGFVERYSKGNIILTTQPLEWTPPSNVPICVIQPLKQDQIEEFLLSRQEILLPDSSVKGSDYEQACKDYLTTILSQQQSEEEQKAVRRMLSNPMELTIVAQMLARGKRPNLLNLQQQQYQEMAEDYIDLYPTRVFPLKAFSETVYQMRLHDKSAIPTDEWIDELLCMERYKMVISRQLVNAEEKQTTKWNFRHDKIQEFFIVQTFLGEQKDNRLNEHISDPRFRGVYFLLATTMPIDAANNLREMLIQHAANTKDHSVSDTFIQLLRSRQTP